MVYAILTAIVTQKNHEKSLFDRGVQGHSVGDSKINLASGLTASQSYGTNVGSLF